MVGLTEKRTAMIVELSRGMRQRLMLAKTLIPEPEVLLLDEPASGLDPQGRIDLKDVLKALAADGKTVLISSHILAEMSEFCTSVAIMERGRMVVSGKIDEIQALIAAAREAGLPMIYVNDHHEDWTAGPRELAEQALAGEAPELIKPILPPEDVPFIVKARHSIFYQTLLEYLLRREGIDRLVLAGQVTEQCILYSALDGYMRHFEVIVDTGAIACIREDLAEGAIQMMKTNLHTTLVESVDEAIAEACRS
jgi:ABC-type glutathione transport system ATPase component